MQSVLIIYCFICKVDIDGPALAQPCPSLLRALRVVMRAGLPDRLGGTHAAEQARRARCKAVIDRLHGVLLSYITCNMSNYTRK